jgi:hypothetical protein
MRIISGISSFQVGGPFTLVWSGGAFLVQSIRFLSHLPLERTDHIQNFKPKPTAHGTKKENNKILSYYCLTKNNKLASLPVTPTIAF